MKKALFVCYLSIAVSVSAQVEIIPKIEPVFFGPNDPITITYDVTGTSLENLSEVWIWLWIPSVGDAPSNTNPATSNISTTNPAKLTKSIVGPNTIFSISISLADFTGFSSSQIQSVGMLLKGNDWSDGQSTDHLLKISKGFSLILGSPLGESGFHNAGENLTITARTSEEAQITIMIDDIQVLSVQNQTTLSTQHSVIDDGEVHEIKVAATNSTDALEAIYTYVVTPVSPLESVPSGLKDGINYSPNGISATMVLLAPNKEHVFVIGDFNDWSINQDYLMKKDGERFWLKINGLEAGKEYVFQYLVDGKIKIADPYARKISSQFDDSEIISENRYPGLSEYPADFTSEAASYLQTDQASFVWSEFVRPEKEDLIIYELLVRDFTEERTFNAVIEKLDYLQGLGINALELMPIMEFEGNQSWGYNPAFMFAVDKYYGTELNLKTLIDEAHKRGIAVILDIVLNHHFGRNSLVRLYNEGLYGRPTSDSPWFNVNAKHPFNVGYDFNHESLFTQQYVDRVNNFWIDEYNIDGFRFDLSKGFTQKNSGSNVGQWGEYDASRISLLKRMADKIWENDPSSYLIMEHFGGSREEKELADYGMMLWGNFNHTFRNATKGSSTSLGGLYHANIGWAKSHLVGYMESHDEERVMWDLKKKGFTTSEGLKRAKIAAAFFLMVPGPKLIWQFGEMGYDQELNNDRLGIKPSHWEYLDDPDRSQMVALYTSLINLRTKTDFVTPDFFEWNTSGWIKWISIDHPKTKFHLIGNFKEEAQTGNYHFPSAGTWYDYFSGEEFEVTNTNQEVILGPAKFRMFSSERVDNYIDVDPLTSIEDSIESTIMIYPNPSSETISIRSEHKIISASILTLSGKKIRSFTEGFNSLDISELSKGVYVLSVFTGKGKINELFLIE